MRFGLTKSEYEFLLQNLVAPLEKSGAKIWCFGSRARGDHSPFSDIDIMVESSLDLSSQINRIIEFFSQSNFPYKVDLVQLSDFAESYMEGYQKDKIQF